MEPAMKINPKMIAIPRGPKSDVKPPELPEPLDGILFDTLELDGVDGDMMLPGN